MRTSVLYVRVPRPVHDAMVDRAEEHMVSLTAFVLRACEFYLEEKFGFDAPNPGGLP
jgi:predicted HicB family RNase H-like nuclease